MNALSIEKKIAIADSLLKEGKNAAALRAYRQIIVNDKIHNEQLLLKMASITEKQGNYPATIYYLHTSYQLEPKTEVREKILQLADKHQLEGYYFTDFDFLSHYFYIYQEELGLTLIFVLFTLLLRMAYNRFKRKPIIYYPLVVFLLLAIAAAILNVQSINQKGIIAYAGSRLMEGPSAASPSFASINQGHRVTILGKTDAWYRINWRSEERYIHSRNLLLLPL